MVKEYGSSPAATRPYGPPTPKMQTDVLDEDGNLRAADIGITWADNETFLHGVRVVGTRIPRPAGHEPVMSTPYPEGRNDDRGTPSITGRPSSPETIEFGPEIIPITRPAADHLHRPTVEARQRYRPAAPIQRFNNKSLNWPAWFRHFRAVADVHGWSKEQRALQLVSYLDETAMNVAQELGDSDLYNYDVLIKLLGERFDPASRVSASRSRFHARSRRHHEDADAFADALAELCRVGYPQSPLELRQELIAEQFVRGQSDLELKKYLWVVIRTQKERKLSGCGHARWLEKCSTLIGGGTGAWLFIWERMARIVIRFQTSRVCRSSGRFSCRYFRSYTEFQLIADGDIIINLDIS